MCSVYKLTLGHKHIFILWESDQSFVFVYSGRDAVFKGYTVLQSQIIFIAEPVPVGKIDTVARSQKGFSAILLKKLTNFFRLFFGRFFSKKWWPYGRQFSSASNFFLRPVLSYFAEFSAGWQH
jgi:hypothetical protein